METEEGADSKGTPCLSSPPPPAPPWWLAPQPLIWFLGMGWAERLSQGGESPSVGIRPPPPCLLSVLPWPGLRWPLPCTLVY